MKAGPMQGRLRRPARGGVFLEFAFGILAGTLASFLLSFATDVSNMSVNTSATPLRAPIAQNSKPAEDVQELSWKPKERLPGYKDPKIACIVTQTQDEAIVPLVINATWGSRCDRLIFTSPRVGIDQKALSAFEQVTVDKDGDKDVNWKTYRSLLHNIKLQDSDYFIFVNDKTYAIPDNVRYEFRGFNPGSDALFWGRKKTVKGLILNTEECLIDFFVLSKTTLATVQSQIDRTDKCGPESGHAEGKLNACLEAIGSPCKQAIDFQGKQQIMDDPIQLLSKSEAPAHLIKDSECCSVLPLAFLNTNKIMGIRTGSFSYHYFFDYFIRDTAVFGREYMRPLNGIDAGVGKPQIGF